MAKNQTIQHKRSTVSGNVPTALQVAKGELALNLTDLAIYTQDASGTIIELAADIRTGASYLGTPSTGDLWYDTTTSALKAWTGTAWINASYTGKTVSPSNTTAVPAFSSGAGSSGSPYILNTTVALGTTVTVGTVTVTGLAPGQFVPVVDLSADANGGRYRFTNNFANDAGTLIFTIEFDDTPASTSGTTYTAQIKVGSGTVYANVVATMIAPFPQTLVSPTNTTSQSTLWTAANNTLTSTGSLLISTDNSTFTQGPLAVSTGNTLYLKWTGAAGSGLGIDGANGATITGNVVSTNTGISSHSLTIGKTVAAYTFTAQTGVGTSSTISSNTVTLSGINSYVYFTSANTMNVAIGVGAFTAVPASGTTIYAINGQTVQVQQTSSASSNTTTTVTLSISGVTGAFAVTTLTTGIATPSIITPISGATDISLAASATSSAFSQVGGLTHTNTDWFLYTSVGVLVQQVTVNSASGKLTSFPLSDFSVIAPSTSYQISVRYSDQSGSAIYSAESAKVAFTTAATPGINWTSRTSGQTATLFGVTYGAGQYIVAGDGVIISSTDGITWTQRLLTSGKQNLSITYGAGQYIASVNDGTVRTSTDGITWTTRSTPLTGQGLYGVSYGGSKYIVVADVGQILTSPDGITWTARTSGSTRTLTNSIYANSQYLVGGSFGTILTSPDGITWTSRTSGTTDSITAITYGSQYVAVDNSGGIRTSTDSITWTQRVAATGNALLSITYGGGQYVAVGTGGRIITSTDGITWTSRTSGSTQTLLAVTYNGTNQFAATGNSGTILTSP